MKHVFVDAKPKDELGVIIIAEKRLFTSLTPYVDKGWIERKRKKDALESESCAILEAINNTSGRITIYSDRKDVIEQLNDDARGKKIEKKLSECLTEIRKLSAKRQILFKYIPKKSNPATNLDDWQECYKQLVGRSRSKPKNHNAQGHADLRTNT